ncbi:MAG: tetratricopeptide repeat protein [Candidatus Lokiarchaeota archaeon]|nr:tetratricopeptide repeat protein [Candidatus Lokiarchaeota archaeon]
MTDKENLIEKARVLIKSEEFEKAIKILEDLYQENSEIVIKNNLIDALFAYGGYLNDNYILEYEKSTTFFKRIIELDPNNYRAHYNLGIAYFNLDLFEEALNSYEMAISINPDYKHSYYNIGLLHEATENFEKAVKAYEKALEIDPNYVYAMHALKAVRMIMDNSVECKSKTQEINDTVEKLKSILSISKRVRFDMIQDILNVNRETLLDIIIIWGNKNYCEIDGDYLIINKESLAQFIEDLNQNGIEV